MKRSERIKRIEELRREFIELEIQICNINSCSKMKELYKKLDKITKEYENLEKEDFEECLDTINRCKHNNNCI